MKGLSFIFTISLFVFSCDSSSENNNLHMADADIVDSAGSDASIDSQKDHGEMGLRITSHGTEETTNTSTKLRFTATDFVQAFTEYGTTTDYGNQTPLEDSFMYKTHLQRIEGLSEGTTYFYRINVTDREGEIATEEGQFQTTGESPLCGNGVLELGEQCDDGDTDNDNECRNDCTLTNPSVEAVPVPWNTHAGLHIYGTSTPGNHGNGDSQLSQNHWLRFKASNWGHHPRNGSSLSRWIWRRV